LPPEDRFFGIKAQNEVSLMVVCLIELSKLSSCSKKPKIVTAKRKIFLLKITVLRTLVNDLESRI